MSGEEDRKSGTEIIEQQWTRHTDGEHPAIVVGDVLRRKRPGAHVITFANETPRSGKSTLAFHCAVALANAGAKVLVVDCDGANGTLGKALAARENSARALGVALPSPKQVTLRRPSGAILLQEIARLGGDCRFVIVDTPSHDMPCTRRAIALADTLVSPVNSQDKDLSSLADSATPPHPGHFAAVAASLRECLQERGREPSDWMLVATRAKAPKGSRAPHIKKAIRDVAKLLDLRLATALPESGAYCDLFTYGLALPDLKHIPGLEDHGQGQDKRIERLLAEMRLPLEGLRGDARRPVRKLEIPRTMRRYSESLRESVGAVAAAI